MEMKSRAFPTMGFFTLCKQLWVLISSPPAMLTSSIDKPDLAKLKQQIL